MPAFTGLQRPILAAADAFLGQKLRPPHLEPPFFVTKLGVDLAHRTAEFDRLGQRLVDQGRTTRRLHHRRRHIARGDDRVLRRGRGVHQVGLVENVAIELARLRILHQDLRRLAQTSQHLVCGLCRKHHRLAATRAVGTDRMIVTVEVMESSVRQPRLIKMQGIDLPVEHVLDGLDVVHHAIVGRLRDRQDARLLAPCLVRERIRGDLLLDVLHRELAQRDRADDAVMVARRGQEHGHRAGHDDGVEDGLVAVAVDDDDIAGRDRCVPHHLVRCRSPVGDKVQVVAVEDARGVALGRRHWTSVIKQLTQFIDRVAHVGAQHVLAEELMEHLPHWALQEGDPPRMARAVPRIGTVRRIVHQRAEERRRQ